MIDLRKALENEEAFTAMELMMDGFKPDENDYRHFTKARGSVANSISRTRGDRHSSRVEAKNPALLSNRDGYLLELTGWTQGSQAS